jgi:hypothetical protein
MTNPFYKEEIIRICFAMKDFFKNNVPNRNRKYGSRPN